MGVIKALGQELYQVCVMVYYLPFLSPFLGLKMQMKCFFMGYTG